MIDDLEMDHGQRMKREKQGFCGKGEWSTKGPSCEPTSHQSPTEGNIMITDIVCAPQSVSGLDQSRGRKEEVQEGRGYGKREIDVTCPSRRYLKITIDLALTSQRYRR
jgi:hypothetical protein